MSSILASSDTPIFSHQLRAMLARQAREDREAVAGSLVRGGFRRKDVELTVNVGGGGFGGRSGGKSKPRSNAVDFSVASPISSRDRQGGGIRLPHFSVSRVNKSIVPKSKDGATHKDHKSAADAAAEHVSYVTDGAQISFGVHVDYVFRSTAVEDVESYMGTVDVLDTEADRKLQNSLATFSNIPGGRARERSLFRAAERCEREPKINDLTASTADAEYWLKLANKAGAPGWVRKAAKPLMAERLKVDARAAKSGRKPRYTQVTIAKVSVSEAYERLSWFDAQPDSAAHKPKFKAGRTGIVQTRFVAELPHGIGARERGEILQQFCGSLANEGWMLVGAIHQPDPHGDRRNFHIHVDGYERPSRWIELEEGDPNDRHGEGGCWDFEYMVRKRGKETYPYRANKIADVGRSPDRKRKSDAQFIKVIRHRYVEIVNEVVGGRPGVPVYFAGTYKEAGINRTSLAHLGNATIAKEKQGVVTPRGSENARNIYLDELEECHSRYAKRAAELDDKVKALRGSAGERRHVRAMIDYYEALATEALQRTLQYELVETVEHMARSRAVAVIEHGVDPDVLAAARAHMQAIDSDAPSPKDREAELKRIQALGAEANSVLKDIGFDLAGLTDKALTQPRSMPVPASAVPAKPRRYAELECRRLRQWLATWAQDPARLIFTETGIELGPEVQQAVHTLFRHYAHDAKIQKLLVAERKRRIAKGIPLGVAPKERASAEPPTASEPIRVRHDEIAPVGHARSAVPIVQAAQSGATGRAMTPAPRGARMHSKGPDTDTQAPIGPRDKGQGR